MTEPQPYNGLLGLDILPKPAKLLIWIAGLFIVAFVSSAVRGRPIARLFALQFIYVNYFVAPPVITLICFTGAVLRLAGIRWRYIFLFWLATIMYYTISWELNYFISGFLFAFS